MAHARQNASVGLLATIPGVGPITASLIAATVGENIAAFRRARHFAAWLGLVPRQHSTGGKPRLGRITKAGNAHVRRIIIEAAWAYQHRPSLGATLRTRQRPLSDAVKAMAWKAQHRLHTRYRRLLAKGKPKPQIVTALGRELLGFIWAIGVHVEQETPRAA